MTPGSTRALQALQHRTGNHGALTLGVRLLIALLVAAAIRQPQHQSLEAQPAKLCSDIDIQMMNSKHQNGCRLQNF